MFTDPQIAAAEALLEACRREGLKLATAESCTGGLIAGLLTSISGASDVFERGFVTYTNQAKTENLDVPAALFDDGRPGAVSEEVARSMAEGALKHSAAEIAVAVTGIAGPDGGTEEKPVGLVHFGAARAGKVTVLATPVFVGGRDAVRMQSVDAAVKLARELAG